jgi:hypothetical protein
MVSSLASTVETEFLKADRETENLTCKRELMILDTFERDRICSSPGEPTL